MDTNVCIVGMGLIGGSLAKAIIEYTPHIVFGIDKNKSVLESAQNENALDAAAVAGSDDAAEILADSDIVILALSPKSTIEFMKKNAEKIKKSAIISDVCGVKRSVAKELAPMCDNAGLRFVGGHPMAGKEHSGFENSDADLFSGASYIFTPSDDLAAQTVETMTDFAYDIGCSRVEITTPDHHDEMIAFTSQLPHVLAGAYIKSPVSAGYMGYSAGSFRDVSRVATVDESLWSDLFLSNKDNLCSEIDGMIARLSEYKTAIENDENAALSEIIKAGRVRKQEIE